MTCQVCFCRQNSLLFNHLTVNNGLSQGVNNCIYKDSRGYVWISSFDGLNRYDGISCLIYREDQQKLHSIKGTLFLNITEDSHGNLWIGSNKGLNFYNRQLNQFVNYQMPDRKADDQLFSPFYIDDKERIWIQSGSDILLFDPYTKKFRVVSHFQVPGNLFIKTVPAAPFNKPEAIYAIVNNTPQVYKGILKSDTLNWQSLLTMEPAGIPGFTCLLPVPGGLWIGGPAGLLYYNNKDISHRIDASGGKKIEDIKTLTFDSKGKLWIGTLRQGLFKLDTLHKIITDHYYASSRNPYSLSGNQIQYLYTDAENHLWAAIWGKGVDYVSLEKFRFNHHLTREESEQLGVNNFMRSIVETDDHQFWCGTQSNGILILDKEKQVSGSISTGLPPAIEHLYKDSKGTIWVATFAGLFTIDPLSRKITQVPFPPAAYTVPGRQFNFIMEITGGILLASSNAGLYLVKKEKNTYSIHAVKGLPERDVYLTSFCDQTGTVYVSRAFKGFMAGTLLGDSFIVKKNFPYQATIKCFYENNDTTLWIGSTIGLLQYHKRLMTVEKIITTSNGLSNQYVYGLLPDKEDLWLSTNAGINRLRLSDGNITIFNAGDGLQSNEFNTYSFCKASNGELLFGGVNGLNSFYPSAIQAYTYPPRLQLSALQVNDAAFTTGVNEGELKTLELKPQENTISFQFTVLDFANPASNRLFYTLKGYDKAWIAAANKSVIRYANLPAGDYVLEAKAINAENVESKNLYTLSITVQKPWWKSWWFITLLLLTTAGVLFIVIKAYLKRKLEQQKIIMERELAIEQERTKMARELHDGLGSKLSGIKHSFSAFKKGLQLPEEQDGAFEVNIGRLNESILELRNLSHSLSTELSLQHGLEYALRDYCNSIHQSGALTISFRILHTEQAILTTEQSFHIFRVVQELLQNTLRHAQASGAIVQMSIHNSHLMITVEDNGKGFDPTVKGDVQGIGLINIQARIKLLKGKIAYRSVFNEGTTVDIEIPIGPQNPVDHPKNG
ncbi:sensor histidine kinase [Paraflavitalea sp. CAU 1676]|uniref:ligand-binding sensor domain-containing protein n=1 Tax=Paraflavitalea sp. CAU 1676 TaxID=3032598 RepID=UPI0023D9FC73|nr:sensor histidine kinase [Paraflavitalea sp. CAU 1676]MDF2187594.1 triple tyrosine motif-containing protein [Paraflavitalea sp. CAU 1676]